MSLSPEVTKRIETIEAKLVELDPIFLDFCARQGFNFCSQIGVWPRRKVWAREDIDRTLDLVTDLTVSEVMERGFYSDTPWSLYGTASFNIPLPGRLLNVTIFRGLPFTQLSEALSAQLEEGLVVLRRITREDVITKGQIHGPTT